MIFADVRKSHKIIFTIIYLFSILMTVAFLMFPVFFPVKLFVLFSSFISSLLYFSHVNMKIMLDPAEGCFFFGNTCCSMDKIIFRKCSKFDKNAGYMIRLKGKIFKVNLKSFYMAETIKLEIYDYLKMYHFGGVVFDSYKEEVPG